MTRKINVGQIGAGRIGRLHAEHLAHRVPEANLLVLADTSESAARACADRCGIPETVSDYHAILERSDIEAVVVCSPTNTHASIIEEAACAGKHIFCEKPIDLDIARVGQALDAVRQGAVKLQMGFNRRFDANFARVHQAVQGGEIGEPHLLHIISRDPAPPPIEYVKVSGGIFMDMTIHDFDMARFLVGAEVEEVFTAAGVMVDPAIGDAGDLDTAIVTLRFENGVIGVIDNSRQAVYGYDQRAEVLGSKGGVGTANNYPNSAVVSTADNTYRDLPLNFFMERYADSFLSEMHKFVAAILDDTPTPVTGNDARAALLMALAARKSHDENRPVRLSEVAP